MRRIFNTILTIIITLTVVSIAFAPIPTQAGAGDIVCLFTPNICKSFDLMGDVFNGTLAIIGEFSLRISAFFLSVSGMLLNISIILTLNIKALYEATPAIDQVWLVIRNLSSMFIIFALIYTSILTILDAAKTSASTLIKNIIMAGILINFSLFFTKTLIDASNLVSLQFYRALVPNSATIDKNNIITVVTKSFTTGGLSDIFMQNMRLPSIYNNPKGFLTGATETNFFKIIIATTGGSILMILAAGSILAAAIAFIIRIVILLLLMGFSPVYFIGMIFPQVKESISNKWLNWLTSQLVFMPIYLIFMYVAVRFLTGINGSGFFNQLDAARATTGSSGNFLMSMVGLILQYTIAYFLLIVPLMAALKLGGDSAKWGVAAQKWVSGAVSGVIGRNTVGRGARLAGKGFDSMAASSQNSSIGKGASTVLRTLGISQAVRGKLNQYENSKFGSKQSLADVEKEDKARSKAISLLKRNTDKKKSLEDAIKTSNRTEIKKVLDGLSNSEISSLDKGKLTDKNVIPFISSNIYSNIEKSDRSDAEKTSILESREKALSDAIRSGNSDEIRLITKNMTGADMQKYLEKTPPNTPISDDLIMHIRASQLKDMDGMDETLRKQIGDSIDVWTGKFQKNHQERKFINDNRDSWVT
jgi:hypothetical protein